VNGELPLPAVIGNSHKMEKYLRIESKSSKQSEKNEENLKSSINLDYHHSIFFGGYCMGEL
jgi:hypothetical protein